MPETKINKQKLFHVGRFFLMLFNRSIMYDANHPYCQQAIDQLRQYQAIFNVLQSNSRSISPNQVVPGQRWSEQGEGSDDSY